MGMPPWLRWLPLLTLLHAVTGQDEEQLVLRKLSDRNARSIANRNVSHCAEPSCDGTLLAG